MKKQIAVTLSTVLVFANITACSKNASLNQDYIQNTVNGSDTYSTEFEPSNTSNKDKQTSASEEVSTEIIPTENVPNEKIRVVYGEAEIPDIPCGNEEREGKANLWAESEALKESIDSMVFETHTFGEYKVNLVGDNVRTDKNRFPGSIYTQGLRIEVENGDGKLIDKTYCSSLVTYGEQYLLEERLFANKIGSYIDIYELENPIIALRYYFDDFSQTDIRRAVQFAILEDDSVCSGFTGISERNTGVMPGDGDIFPITSNHDDGEECYMSIFSADKFTVVDNKTLLDEEAGIKYTFEFTNPPPLPLYKTEKVRAIYGETEIPDIPCGSKDMEGKANDLYDQEALKQCLDSMVFETHTFGEYKISLVGDRVRTDKANFPGSIYTDDLRIEVEKNGTAIGSESDDAIGYYNNTATYVSQFLNEYRLFEDKLGSYIDMYELENPVIAMRYFYDDDPERTVKKAVEFATIQNDEVCTGFIGISEIGTGVCLNLNDDSGKPENKLIVNTKDGDHCRMSIFAADEFKIVNSKTLCDEELDIKYTFEFSDPPKMELYKTEKAVRAIYGETEIPDIPYEGPDKEGRSNGGFKDDVVLEGCLDSMVFETHQCGEYKISLVGDSVRTDKASFPGSIYARDLRIEVEKSGTKIKQDIGGYSAGYCSMFLYVPQYSTDYRLFEDKIGSYIDMYKLDEPVITMRYFYDDDPERTVKKAMQFAAVLDNALCVGFFGVSDIGTGIILGDPLALNNKDGEACLMSTFSSDEFEVLDGKTLLDRAAGIKYTFNFTDMQNGELYTAEKTAEF